MKNNVTKDILYSSIRWDSLFVVVVAVYPYIFLMQMIFPLHLLGFNLYFAAITAYIFIYLLVRLPVLLNDLNLKLFTYISIAYLVFLCAHFVIYDENIRSIMTYRIGITPIIYLAVSFIALQKKYNKLFFYIIVINGVLMATIGIVHHHYFPHIVTGAWYTLEPGQMYAILEQGQGGQPESGILISISLYANMCLLSLFLILFKNDIKSSKIILKIKPVIISILIYGIILSESRYVISSAVLIIAFYVLKQVAFFKLKQQLLVTLISLVAIISVFAFTYSDVFNALNSLLEEGMGVRAQKNALAYQVVFNDISNIMFGTDINNYNSITSSSGVSISDNSYFAIALNFGVIFLLNLIFIFAVMIRKIILSSEGSFMLMLYFSMNLYITNSIYWDIYLLYFSLVLCVLTPKFMHVIKEKEEYLISFDELGTWSKGSSKGVRLIC